MSAEAPFPSGVGARIAARTRRHRIAGALAALTFLVFAPVLGNEFLLVDDDHYITANPHVTPGITHQGIRWALTSTDRDNWQPLTWIGHMIAVEISGTRPWGHHLLSVLLHALASLLLFLFLARTTGAQASGLFVAALFALHPLRLESVAWAAELKDPLSGVLFMLTLTCYAGYAARRRGRDFFALTLTFALALTAKPTVVALPLVLLLLDYWPLARWSRADARRLLLEKVPLLVLAAAASLLTLEAQSRVGALRTLDVITLGSRVQNALVSTVSYLGKLFWPLHLSVYYPLSPDALAPTAVIAAGSALLAITIGTLLARRTAPALTVGWFWYLAMLAPVSGIVQVGLQSMADRYTYLPQVGLGIALVWGTAHIGRALGPVRGPRLVRALAWAGALCLLRFAALTPFRARAWHDTVRLFANALAQNPANWFAHLKLAEVHLGRERVVEGLPHAKRAVDANPDFPNSRLVYGILLGKSGRDREAQTQFGEALRLAPGWAEALHHLGLALFRQGRLDDAEGHCRDWLRVEQESGPARILLGRIAEARGDNPRALAAYRAALALNPRLDEARTGLERLGTAP